MWGDACLRGDAYCWEMCTFGGCDASGGDAISAFLKESLAKNLPEWGF